MNNLQKLGILGVAGVGAYGLYAGWFSSDDDTTTTTSGSGSSGDLTTDEGVSAVDWATELINSLNEQEKSSEEFFAEEQETSGDYSTIKKSSVANTEATAIYDSSGKIIGVDDPVAQQSREATATEKLLNQAIPDKTSASEYFKKKTESSK